MDPLTSISLAGTIVQFVDFGGKVISKVKDLKNNVGGNSRDLFNSELIAKDLLTLSQRLRDGTHPHSADRLSADDQALEDLCDGCITLSKRMLQRLQSLEVSQGAGNFQVLQQAIKAVWSEKEIESMSTQLGEFRDQLQLRILTSFKLVLPTLQGLSPNQIRQRMDLDLLSRQVSVNSNAKHLIEALRDNQDAFSSQLIDQTKTFFNLQKETRILNAEEHEITRSVIVNAITQVTRKGYDGEKRPPRPRVTTKAEEARIKQQAEDRILKSLLFQSISARYLQVAKAHQDTFQWIFRDPPVDASYHWSNFANWLQFENGIYWVSGKAGSGKSTLMKFLSDHERTQQLLQSWSHPLSPDIVSFYFWNSGTPEQKSCNGLLRTLLYDVLSKHRELIPILLPDQWRDEYVSATEFYQRFYWDFDIMCEAFDILRAQNGIRLCIFIDGLDEYDADTMGTHADVVALFKTMVASTNIKLCVSSRPWLVFEDAFSSTPSLRIEKLTSSDINHYVEDKLLGNLRMIQLRGADPVNTEFLTKEIVYKASGVFLWVVLVVRSLLDGLTNRDRISDLRRRLKMLPADLEDLYKHMLLKHIDPFYHEQSAQMFRIVFAIGTCEYSISKEVNLLMLAFADEDANSALQAPVWQLSQRVLADLCSEMEDRLKSRCAGLLEVSGDRSNVTELEVKFLHRTVHDFLKLPEIEGMLVARSGAAFDPYERILKACLLWLQQVTVSSADDSFFEVLRIVRRSLIYARQSNQLTRSSNLLLLDELDKSVLYHWMSVPRFSQGIDQRTTGLHWADDRNHRPAAEDTHDNFISLTVEYGLTEYVREKLTQDHQVLQKKSGRPLLHYLVGNGDCRQPEVEMAKVLLQHGADPTLRYHGSCMMDYAFGYSQEESVVAASWRQIYTLMVNSGHYQRYQKPNINSLEPEISERADPWETRVEPKQGKKHTKSIRSWLQHKFRK